MKPLNLYLLLFAVSLLLSACAPGNLVSFSFEEFPEGPPNLSEPNKYIVNHTNPVAPTKGSCLYWSTGEVIILEDPGDYPLKLVLDNDLAGKSLKYSCQDHSSFPNAELCFISETISVNEQDTLVFSWLGKPHFTNAGSPFIVEGRLNIGGSSRVFRLKMTKQDLYLGKKKKSGFNYNKLGALPADEAHLIQVTIRMETQKMDIRIDGESYLYELFDQPLASSGDLISAGPSKKLNISLFWDTDSQTKYSYYLIDEIRIKK